VIPWS